MARRRELQGIANALTGSFVSRNNDFKGYWSVGQLKSLAINNGLTSITFSLNTLKASTDCDLLTFIEHHYTSMFENLLIKQQVPKIWIKEANIMIDFNADAGHSWLHDCSTSGQAFQCSCQITDDNLRNYSSIIYGISAPHSAEKELKSTRKFTL